MNWKQLRQMVLLATMSLMSVGCLVSSDTHQSRTGNYVPDSTFNQIKPGKTTEDWVRGTLGPPTSVSKLDNGTQLWKYSYTERRESSGAVFLIFGGHDEKEQIHTAFVELKEGLVTNAWRG
jgi:outer membrane protein assembly factor BamE (lipoprotein component of BamABCDE complex)